MKNINVDENGVIEIFDKQLMISISGGFNAVSSINSFVFDESIINAGLEFDLGETCNNCPIANYLGCGSNASCGEDVLTFEQVVLPNMNELL